MLGSSRTGGTSCLRRYRLEAERGDADLLPRQGAFAGLTLNGAKISATMIPCTPSTEDTSRPRRIDGQGTIPAAAEPFLAAVREAKAQPERQG